MGVTAFTKNGDKWIDGDPITWLDDNGSSILESDENIVITIDGRCEKKIYIDWSHLESADNGDTTYYGGYVRVRAKTHHATQFDVEFQGWGNDRSDSVHGNILNLLRDVIEEAILGGTGIEIIQNPESWPGRPENTKVEVDKELLMRFMKCAEHWFGVCVDESLNDDGDAALWNEFAKAVNYTGGK